MGPNPNGPRSVRYDRAVRYSGFSGVRETWVLLVISWNRGSSGIRKVLSTSFFRLHMVFQEAAIFLKSGFLFQETTFAIDNSNFLCFCPN